MPCARRARTSASGLTASTSRSSPPAAAACWAWAPSRRACSPHRGPSWAAPRPSARRPRLDRCPRPRRAIASGTTGLRAVASTATVVVAIVAAAVSIGIADPAATTAARAATIGRAAHSIGIVDPAVTTGPLRVATARDPGERDPRLRGRRPDDGPRHGR